MNIFENRSACPMLINMESDPFNSMDYIFELKLDGIRCLAYLDEAGTSLYTRRNRHVSGIYPEIDAMHKQVTRRCILDGELVMMEGGKPDFEELMRRTLMSNSFKIGLAAAKSSVSFTAFDILFVDDRQLTEKPLMERKSMLNDIVKEDNRLSISRFIEIEGIAFYNLAKQNGLEGIVAKKKDSRYLMGKQTKEWIKIKNILDDDFVVCGYILQESAVISIILGQYGKNGLQYKGHVTLGIARDEFKKIKDNETTEEHPFTTLPSGNENTIWIKPDLVCTVQFLEKTPNGSLRHPVFKCLRDDKDPKECIE